MKANAKPEFSRKWWISEKPSEIKGAELEKALGAAEKALADEKKKSDAASIEACLSALGLVGTAADKTIAKECDKKKHKDEITVLKRYNELVKSETKRLEELQKKLAAAEKEDDDEEEEISDDKLFSKDYLYKMCKLLKSTGKELKFGFALDTKAPENSQLLLHRKFKPERLYKKLKNTRQFTNRVMTYGYAVPDPKDGKTLVFKLEDSAGEPPQIVKLGRRFLRSDKNLRFRKLKLILPGGEAVEDDEPDNEDEEDVIVAEAAGGAAADDLAQRLRGAAAAADVWKRTRESVDDQIALLRSELAGFDDPEVKSIRDRLPSLLDRYPELDFSVLARSADQAAYDRSLAATRQGIAQWARLLGRDPALRTIDENPFVKTNVVAAYGDALRNIASELKI